MMVNFSNTMMEFLRLCFKRKKTSGLGHIYPMNLRWQEFDRKILGGFGFLSEKKGATSIRRLKPIVTPERCVIPNKLRITMRLSSVGVKQAGNRGKTWSMSER